MTSGFSQAEEVDHRWTLSYWMLIMIGHESVEQECVMPIKCVILVANAWELSALHTFFAQLIQEKLIVTKDCATRSTMRNQRGLQSEETFGVAHSLINVPFNGTVKKLELHFRFRMSQKHKTNFKNKGNTWMPSWHFPFLYKTELFIFFLDYKKCVLVCNYVYT